MAAVSNGCDNEAAGGDDARETSPVGEVATDSAASRRSFDRRTRLPPTSLGVRKGPPSLISHGHSTPSPGSGRLVVVGSRCD